MNHKRNKLEKPQERFFDRQVNLKLHTFKEEASLKIECEGPWGGIQLIDMESIAKKFL